MTRRRWLATALTTAVAGAYPTLVEPRWLHLTQTPIALPTGPRQPLTLLHLSDLHASFVVPWSLIENAIDLGLAAKPDVICVTGDFITHAADFDIARYVNLLRRLSTAAPTFAVLGNHDGGTWAASRRGYSDHTVVDRILEDAAIHLLHNRAVTLTLRDAPLTLVGVGDLWSGELEAAQAFRNLPAGTPRVLLSHNPDSKAALNPFPWHLMLCGHTHGGQVMIPFEWPRYAPVEDKRYVSGLNPYAGRLIYTSRGVGNVGSVRFRCRPEVAVLQLG